MSLTNFFAASIEGSSELATAIIKEEGAEDIFTEVSHTIQVWWSRSRVDRIPRFIERN